MPYTHNALSSLAPVATSGQNTVCTRNIADSLYPLNTNFIEKYEEKRFPYNQPCFFGIFVTKKRSLF